MIKRIAILITSMGILASEVHAAPPSTNFVATNCVLMIDVSSMPVGTGTATLTIGPLRYREGVYAGEYKMKVFPYFYKNENGKLAITVSDAMLAEVTQGKITAVTGTSTTIGKSGRTRHIDATVSPIDAGHGTLKLWFMAGTRKMTFSPAYRFVAAEKAVGPPLFTGTNTGGAVSAPLPAAKP